MLVYTVVLCAMYPSAVVDVVCVSSYVLLEHFEDTLLRRGFPAPIS